MTTRTQIIERLKAAKHEHGKRLGGLMNCRKKEDSNEQCECGADQKNASIDAAIALLEKQPAEQVEPVAYPDKGLIEEWWDAHDRKRFDPTYPSENWTEVVVRRAIDWHRNQQASASKEVPADEVQQS